jgi:hypothetical protein
MSFLKTLFGIRDRTPKPAEEMPEQEYKGFMIRAEPYGVGSQFQLAGSISREVDGQLRTHKFVRADQFGTAEEAASFALRKGCQIIDEQGLRIFD